MKDIKTRDIKTERLDLRIPTMKEQKRLWEILCNDDVNNLYFPTPDRIFNKNELDKSNIEDAKKAREIFLSQLKDWERQEPFYEKKIVSIGNQDNSNKFTWSIFIKDTDTVIGQITCQPKSDEIESIRDVGWYIDPAYQGKGYATEAAKAMIDYMFTEVEIDEIRTSAATINPASWKIMERLGFTYNGDYRSTYFIDNEFLTCKKYNITRDEYLRGK